jgi:predicted acetyltransferase
VTEVTFRAPEPSDETEVAEAQRTMAREHFRFAFGYTPGDDFSQWVQLMAARRTGKDVSPGWVAATFELAIIDRRIAGRLSVRHALNDFLLQQGGHIGYCLLPAFRGLGFGKRMLQRGLDLTADLGIERVLITCDEDNTISRRIIENAGGRYESSYAGADVRVPIRRYWIDESSPTRAIRPQSGSAV